jgi:hypothetical protein
MPGSAGVEDIRVASDVMAHNDDGSGQLAIASGNRNQVTHAIHEGHD